MKKKLLATATALTIMGTGLAASGNLVQAEEAKNTTQTTDSLKFTDVPTEHWSYKAIHDLANQNILSGYGNGIFGFGDDVTREQVARLLFAYMKPAEDPNFKNPYNDIEGSMFEKEILAVTKAGIMEGYDNSFRPKDTLTRGEMATVLTKAFELKIKAPHTFTDSDASYWGNDYISALQSNGLTEGTGNGKFEPYTKVSREQYAQFLWKAINKDKNENGNGGTTEPPVTPPTTGGEGGGTTEPPVTPPTTGGEGGGTTEPPVTPPTKPDVPEWLDSTLATEDFTFNKAWYEGAAVTNISASKEAQDLVKSINEKYGTTLKYREIASSVNLKDKNMYLPEGTFNSQFEVSGVEADDYTMNFYYKNEAIVQLTKEWVKLLNPDLNLDGEIDEIVANPAIKNYEKGKYHIRIGRSTAEQMLYIQVSPK